MYICIVLSTESTYILFITRKRKCYSHSTKSGKFQKQSRIGIVISASHSCGAELSLLRLKGLPEPVLYDRISTLRFLFITALLEL